MAAFRVYAFSVAIVPYVLFAIFVYADYLLNNYVSWFFQFYYAVGVIVYIVRLWISGRKTFAKIAWTFFLLSLPIFAVPIFWVVDIVRCNKILH